MYPILKAEKLADKIYLMEVKAPRVAKSCQPGEFVIVKIDEAGERIPLTICDYDREEGTITIVFQTVGASSEKMSRLQAGDSFHDFVGPLGNPSEFVKEDLEVLKNKKYLFVAGGVGTAPVYPQVKWLKEHGIDADVIVGAKTKDLLILEDEFNACSDELRIMTDDGSYGTKGVVTAALDELVAAGNQYDLVITIDGREAKSYSSQGQTRTAALALKLAGREIYQNATGEYPVLLLDDVLSELDPRRQEFVLNRIAGGQVFITCCEDDRLPVLLGGKVFHVKQGAIG